MIQCISLVSMFTGIAKELLQVQLQEVSTALD